MRYWIGPFLLGLIFAGGLVAAAFLAPAFLPASMTESLLKPNYRIDRDLLMVRFIPDVTIAQRQSFVLSAVTVLCGYILVSLYHVIMRPDGPGGAGAIGRHLIWTIIFFVVIACSSVGTYLSLTMSLNFVEEAVATQWTLYVALAAGGAFWLITIFGSEPMMRPAVPLATRLYPA